MAKSRPWCSLKVSRGRSRRPLDGQQALQVGGVLLELLVDVVLDAVRQQLQAALPPLELARGLVQERLQHAQLERQRARLRDIVNHRLGQPQGIPVFPAVCNM